MLLNRNITYTHTHSHSSWLLWQSPHPPGQCLDRSLSQPSRIPIVLFFFIFLLQLLCEDKICNHRSNTTLFLLSTNAHVKRSPLSCLCNYSIFLTGSNILCFVDSVSIIIQYKTALDTQTTSFRIKLSFLHILVFCASVFYLNASPGTYWPPLWVSIGDL